MSETSLRKSVLKAIETKRGRMIMATYLLVARKDQRWTQKQVMRLVATLESIADAFGMDAEKMVYRIMDSDEFKECPHV